MTEPVTSVQTEPVVTPEAVPTPAPVPQVPEYRELTRKFFKSTVKGQIQSMWRKKDNPARIAEYKKAIAAGLVKLEKLNKNLYNKMVTMGVEVPLEFRPPLHPKTAIIRLTKRQVERLAAEFNISTPDAMLPIVKPRKPRTPKAAVVTPPVPATPI